jgi:hypothetical protein
METRNRPVQVRPRKGSVLEFVQSQTANNMAEIVHDWAQNDPSWLAQFSQNVAQSERETTDE